MTDIETGRVDDGIVGPDRIGHLLPFLAESVCLYTRTGELVSRISRPGGVLGYGADVGSNIYENIHPEDLPAGIQLGSAIGASKRGWSGTFKLRLLHADGSYRPYQLRVFNEVGNPDLNGIVLCIRECVGDEAIITEGIDHEPLARSLADVLPTASLILDLQGRIRHVSPTAAELLGRSEADLFGRELSELAGDADRMVLRSAGAAVLREPCERVVLFHRPGQDHGLVLEAQIRSRGSSARPNLVTVILTDRTDEPELVRRATRDQLTGLANRALVIDTLSGLLLDEDPKVSVLYCDLDRFKLLNDAHGHETGDVALVAIAERLQASVRPSDLVGRMGGDEFVIVCPGLSAEDATLLAVRLGVEVTAHADGWCQVVGLSAGAATAQPGDTASDVLRRADKRMFEAKRARHLRLARTVNRPVRRVARTG